MKRLSKVLVASPNSLQESDKKETFSNTFSSAHSSLRGDEVRKEEESVGGTWWNKDD